jgi:CheY-like chemotaxis protein
MKRNSHPQSECTAVSGSNPASVPLPSGDGEVVMVVEDEQRVRDVTVARLIALGYRVLVASTGVAAVKMLEEHPEVEVLFSDLVLPGGLSGLDLAKCVQEAHPDVHVILTSGYSTELMREWGEDVDLQVLPKPYRQADLARIFHEALTTRRSRAGSGKAEGAA